MADKLEDRKVMLTTGHKTDSVFRKYSDHALAEDLERVAETSDDIFGQLLPEKLMA
jgi:hypothetical protein